MPSLVIAFLVSLALVPVIRWGGRRAGLVARPQSDRWHQRPTPIFGGVAMFIGFAAGLLAAAPRAGLPWGILAGAALMFAFGLYDDFRPLTPPVKLLGQFAAASVVVFSGYQTQFFEVVLFNTLITVTWLVGISNAINLIDNMDGLAGGIALITAGLLAFFFWPSQGPYLALSLALAGAAAGFLVYNFPPASIFMGDSGSLFLGFTLAALAIARTPQASNVFAVLGVPTLLFLLPIVDTTLVTLTRLLRGQSPAQRTRGHRQILRRNTRKETRPWRTTSRSSARPRPSSWPPA